jgi:beta-glucanase (GH16 family)
MERINRGEILFLAKIQTYMLRLSILLLSLCTLSCKSEGPINDPDTIIKNLPVVVPKEYTFAATPFWADEFDKDGLPDATKWGYDEGGSGWGNNELQYYTKANIKNAHIDNGVLTIEAIKEKLDNRNYTSARLVTQGKNDFLYGRVEARAKIPAGRGNWAAIWMLASQTDYGKQFWPDNGEIDILEHVGYDPGIIHSSVHTKAYNHMINTQKTSRAILDKWDTEFHLFRIDWTPDYVRAFIDGKQFFEFQNSKSGWEQWPFDKKQHILMNLAIGGNWGGQKGVDDTIFPNKFQIDYIRVYALNQ